MPGLIGPNAKVRVGGKGDHDIATIEWTTTKEKTPFVPLGAEDPDRYTSGPRAHTFTATVQSKPDGSFAIAWDDICNYDLVIQLACEAFGRTERLVDLVIDEVGNTLSKDDGSWQKSVSGKFARHEFV